MDHWFMLFPARASRILFALYLQRPDMINLFHDLTQDRHVRNKEIKP